MDEAADKIEAQIDRTRERLGSNLRELEDRIDAATDWREQFRARPHLFLGGAIASGALLAAALRLTVSAASVRLFHRRPSRIRLAQRGRRPGAGTRTVEQHQRCADRSGRHADHCIHLGVGPGIRRTLSARGTET